ncbi:capsular polysaccharide biosynthesis protein [Thermocatellispora tengchongensis]|uniref:Capsular polysaccharide biosynthesis protein n=1 Tax=Thermocatellispora tengchongensis TaxID=1073253 RepID=A0A840P640_9ACTN|nr:lipopolysaccharide biosynthesis protein [Thermocatellispora tengchongensis]MBB5133373.1 capsular polysaccharide biosynthesis protein [Thermocatellispora tengchongensis]
MRARLTDRRLWAAAALVLGAAAGAVFWLLAPPGYTSEAYVAVVAEGGDDGARAVHFAQAYARIAAKPAIVAAGGDPFLANEDLLRRTVQASASPDAPLVRIGASAGDAALAARRANLVADALVAYANRRSADTRIRLSVFARALPPRSPASPSPLPHAGIGAAAALLICGIVCLAGPARPAPAPRTAPGAVPQEVGA